MTQAQKAGGGSGKTTDDVLDEIASDILTKVCMSHVMHTAYVLYSIRMLSGIKFALDKKRETKSTKKYKTCHMYMYFNKLMQNSNCVKILPLGLIPPKFSCHSKLSSIYIQCTCNHAKVSLYMYMYNLIHVAAPSI